MTQHIIDTDELEAELQSAYRFDDLITAIRALVANSPKADEMVLVPSEPTDEMLERVWQRSKVNELTDDAYEGVIKRNAAIDYKAMLSAYKPQADDVRKDAWISVEDKLPNDGQEVQIFLPNYGTFTGYYSRSPVGGSWWCKAISNTVYPTHWQPLPSSPLDKARG